jgi:hypothetical protein
MACEDVYKLIQDAYNINFTINNIRQASSTIDPSNLDYAVQQAKDLLNYAQAIYNGLEDCQKRYMLPPGFI